MDKARKVGKEMEPPLGYFSFLFEVKAAYISTHFINSCHINYSHANVVSKPSHFSEENSSGSAPGPQANNYSGVFKSFLLT